MRAINDPAARTAYCRALTARLPDWFGISDANDHYASGIAGCDVFGVFDTEGVCVGLIALRPHFSDVLEIWWMAVDPGWHRKGVGSALMAKAAEVARAQGRRTMIVMTLSPESDDARYAATRRFYEARGFRPLIAIEHGPQDDPLMWMIRDLG